jgi:Restriction endonuclease
VATGSRASDTALEESLRSPSRPALENFGISAEQFAFFQRAQAQPNTSTALVEFVVVPVLQAVFLGAVLFVPGMVAGVIFQRSGIPTMFFIAGALIGLLYGLNGAAAEASRRDHQRLELSPDVRECCAKYAQALGDYNRALWEYERLRGTYWTKMSGPTFELELARLMQRLGYSATPTKVSGDGGVDIVATKGTSRVVVQCKAWSRPAGPGPVRELQGVRKVGEEAWIVCLGGFTAGALSFAKAAGIRTLTLADVIRMDAESRKPAS